MKNIAKIAIFAAIFFVMMLAILPITIMVGGVFVPFILAGAAIGFAVIGYIFGERILFDRKQFQYASILSAVACVLIACSCEVVGVTAWFAYLTTPFSYPAPYPNAEVKETWRDVGHGQYGAVHFEYVADVPLQKIEDYYRLEMQNYCVDGWQFAETDVACEGYDVCRTAECEIPRPLVKGAQYFSVYLRSVSESQTDVLYIQKTINR